jgi:hypothetical protein
MRLSLLLVAILALSSAALANEFTAYRRPDPKVFAQGIAAYDAGDYAKAFDIWLPMARSGDLAAAFNIGLMLRDGRGVPKDEVRALTFFKKAAERGHVGSSVNLADMYYTGAGTKQNYLEAGRWLMILSRRGHYPSMYKLAQMFERGEGIERNEKAARTLYLLAYKGGYQLAGNRLSELAEKSNARVEPGGAPQASVAPLAADSTGRQAAGVALPLLRLRGPIGANGEASEASEVSLFALRSTIASMTPLEREIYGVGTTAKTVEGASRASAGEEPRLCRSHRRFEPPATVCRMPPVRD